MKNRLMILMLGVLPAGPGDAVDLGIGLSSSMDGRNVPALAAALPVGTSWVISGTSAGVRTKAYLHNTYTLSLLQRAKIPSGYLGTINLGIGLGMHYGFRTFAAPTGDGDTREFKDQDVDVGPAFRLAFHPLERFFWGFDFVMGLGPGVLGLGFADSGVFMVGVRL